MLYKEIKKYLNREGISQASLAKRIGMHIVTLNAILNGNRKLLAEEYFEICKALNLEANYFKDHQSDQAS